MAGKGRSGDPFDKARETREMGENKTGDKAMEGDKARAA
jgi:hypothetical protein